MSYKDIIKENEKHSPIKWWPHFAYHYTDVKNAVSIMENGTLYSRMRAEESNIMINDNASQQVINVTASDITSYVRFYFRPLTPTQYHNEGYKHRALRYDGDPNANVPVPIFLLFNLDQLLSDPNTLFSEGSEAGAGHPLLHGEEAFSSLNFDMIYKNGPYLSQTPEEKKREGSYRQSEILYPEKYPIINSLNWIVCRNAEERATFLNMLKDKSYRLFNTWKSRTCITNNGLYYNNGLYVSECSFHDTDFSIVFSDSYPRKKYAKEHNNDYPPIKAGIQFDWLRGNNILFRKEFEWNLPYFDAKQVSFHKLPHVKGAVELSVKISFDDQIMCYKRYSLNQGEF